MIFVPVGCHDVELCAFVPPASDSREAEGQGVLSIQAPQILPAGILVDPRGILLQHRLDGILIDAVHVSRLQLGNVGEDKSVPGAEKVIGDLIQPTLHIGLFLDAVGYGELPPDETQVDEVFKVDREFIFIDLRLLEDIVSLVLPRATASMMVLFFWAS